MKKKNVLPQTPGNRTLSASAVLCAAQIVIGANHTSVAASVPKLLVDFTAPTQLGQSIVSLTKQIHLPIPHFAIG